MEGFASVATARLEVERTRNCRRVHAREARSVAIQETFVESRRKVPAPFDSCAYAFLTPRRRFCDATMTRKLKRDEIRINRHRVLGYCLSMIFSENRCALFRIML
jgi:hypothetical protein